LPKRSSMSPKSDHRSAALALSRDYARGAQKLGELTGYISSTIG
jgi:hypothetical protein